MWKLSLVGIEYIHLVANDLAHLISTLWYLMSYTRSPFCCKFKQDTVLVKPRIAFELSRGSHQTCFDSNYSPKLPTTVPGG